MEERRDPFQAIADPVRRDIIGLLAHKSLTVNSVVDEFSISRPAISRHLRILNECGVIRFKKQGRERLCELQPKNLMPVADWVAPYRKMWEERLDTFEDYLEQLQAKHKQDE
ncbi:MAG: metalloregulator ArsR/SmtB family transcription factor [Bacteroidota bacterium]